jgi:hypothetical protein
LSFRYEYWPTFEAVVFTVVACAFTPRLRRRRSGLGPVRRKQFLILDSVPYRYQQFISDISGQDIRCHNASPDRAIDIVRNWLRNTSRKRVPGPVAIKRQFAQFVEWLPENCERNGFDRNDLLFIEYVEMARQWIAASNQMNGRRTSRQPTSRTRHQLKSQVGRAARG